VSRRPTDWSPLAGSDPVPGDPDETERIATKYVDTATALRDQAARLKALASDRSWDSEAGEQWRRQGREVAGKLGRVVGRYETAGNALRTYSGALRNAQAQADRALTLAQDADRRQRSIREAVRAENQRQAQQAPGTPPADTSHLDRQAAQATADLERAHRLLSSAVAVRDAAADHAAAAIQTITEEDGLNDGRFAGVGKVFSDAFEWVDRNLKAITDIAGWVATIAGMLALAVGWIPVIGQIAGAVLTAIAALASLVALIGSLVMAVQGRGSWLDVGLNAFSLVTMGIGRAALTGAKVGARGARAAAQAGRTEELVAAAVLARGGARVGGKALRRMTIAARRQAKAQPGGGLTRDPVADGLSTAPSRLPGNLAQAMSPRVFWAETKDGVQQLFQGSNWQAAWTGLRSQHGVNPVLDSATRAELDRAAQLTAGARDLPGVSSYLSSSTWQQANLYSSTALGTSVDVADKSHAFDGAKPHLMTPPR
jgi:hypothetical protein